MLHRLLAALLALLICLVVPGARADQVLTLDNFLSRFTSPPLIGGIHVGPFNCAPDKTKLSVTMWGIDAMKLTSTKDASRLAELLRNTANPSRDLILQAADMIDLLVKRERDAQDIIHRRKGKDENVVS